MKSKWMWISEKLHELGLKELAEQAETIDKHLRKIYGDTVTKCWEEDLEIVEHEYYKLQQPYQRLEYIKNICHEEEYCVACAVDVVCWECRYAREWGRCGHDESEYSQFIDELDIAIEKLRCGRDG